MKQAFLDRYGNPDANGDGILDPDWFRENIVVFEAPFPMVLSWRPKDMTRHFQAHRLAGGRIVSALSRIAAAHGLPYLRDHKLDRWGGCFNFRLIRGGDELSVHAWGAAVDWCPDIGRMGSAEDAATYPRFIVEAFEAEGFYWGGNWKVRPDPMHFELQE
jgi:hypothetical protein